MYHDLGTTPSANMTYMAYTKNPALPRVRREVVYLVKQADGIATNTRHVLVCGIWHDVDDIPSKWCQGVGGLRFLDKI